MAAAWSAGCWYHVSEWAMHAAIVVLWFGMMQILCGRAADARTRASELHIMIDDGRVCLFFNKAIIASPSHHLIALLVTGAYSSHLLLLTHLFAPSCRSRQYQHAEKHYLWLILTTRATYTKQSLMIRCAPTMPIWLFYVLYYYYYYSQPLRDTTWYYIVLLSIIRS